MRRVAAILAIVVGVTLIGFTVVEHLFSRSEDAQTISDRYRGLMSKEGLADLSRGFAAVQAAGGQLATEAEPRLQQALGMTDQQFSAYVAQEMPGIAQFDEQAPGVVKLVGPVIQQMNDARPDYARAAAIPTSWLPLTSAPWLFLGIGALLVVVGAFALIRPGQLATVALLLVGLGIAIAPLVIGIPGKVDAAVRVTAIGRIGLAPATGQAAVGATTLFDNMVSDVQTTLEPALTRQLGLSDQAGKAAFAQSFPELASFADDWRASTSKKSHELSDSQVEMAPVFANADQIPLRPIPWLFIVPGLVLAALAGASLVLDARTRQDSTTPSGTGGSSNPTAAPPAERVVAQTVPR